MAHFTKDKGDIGVAKIIADLAVQGYSVMLPISEHLPFDLVIVSEEAKLLRCQVKYRSLNSDNKIQVEVKNTASNSNGYYTKLVDFEKIDVYAIYCPDLDKCYYMPTKLVKQYTSKFTLNAASEKTSQMNFYHLDFSALKAEYFTDT